MIINQFPVYCTKLYLWEDSGIQSTASTGVYVFQNVYHYKITRIYHVIAYDVGAVLW